VMSKRPSYGRSANYIAEASGWRSQEFEGGGDKRRALGKGRNWLANAKGPGQRCVLGEGKATGVGEKTRRRGKKDERNGKGERARM